MTFIGDMGLVEEFFGIEAKVLLVVEV